MNKSLYKKMEILVYVSATEAGMFGSVLEKNVLEFSSLYRDIL